MIHITKDRKYCDIDKKHKELFKKCLEYDSVFYIQGQYSNKRKSNKAYLINRDGSFLTGLLPRVTGYLKKKSIKFKIINRDKEVFKKEKDPFLNGLDYKNEQTLLQLGAVEKAIKLQRGIIKLPTGTGKTVVSLLLMSAYPSARILFLCHTIDLLYQTVEELKKYGFKNIKIIGAGKKEEYLHLDNCIVVSIDKSFIKQTDYDLFFDIVVNDECHHSNSEKSYFAQILQNCYAPIKIGLSATPHTEGKKQLVQEGILGPIIAELTVTEAVKQGILLPIKLNLIPVPVNKEFDDYKASFKSTYQKVIIEGKVRNKLIVEESLKFGTCLIMIKDIKHGENIYQMFKKVHPEVKVKFVRGKVKGEERVKIKKQLNDKELDVVIATSVWKEGVNIPTLNHVINACGYKSEIPALQMLGRGSRKAEGKDQLVLTDFIDCYKKLAIHFAYRMTAYKTSGWI